MKIILPVIFLTMLLMFGCTQDDDKSEDQNEEDTLTVAQLDSIAKADTLAYYDKIFPKIKYHKIVIEDWRHLNQIKKQYPSDKKWKKYKALMTLNRKEMRYFTKRDTIIVPDTVVDDMRAYSVFPQFYWEARKIPKIIMVSNKYQAYGCYAFGKLVRFAASNTGKEKTPTFPGRYALVWREREHRSSLDSNWKMPFTWNYHPFAGNAFHKFSMPGRPVSHSCCRQFLDDAEWLYYWGEPAKYDSNRKRIEFSGTPVIIIDIFDFSRKRYGPWIDLKDNKSFMLELPEKPMEVEEALIPWCQIPDGSKGSIPNKKRFIYAEDTLRARGIIRPHVKLTQTVNYNQKRLQKALAEAKKKKEEELKRQKELEEKLQKYIKDNKNEKTEDNLKPGADVKYENPDSKNILKKNEFGPPPPNPEPDKKKEVKTPPDNY